MKTFRHVRRCAKRRKRGVVLSALLIGSMPCVCFAGINDTWHDVQGYFAYMTGVQEEIRNYRAAQESVEEARMNLVGARQNLADAKTAREEATENLAQAGEQLKAAETHLGALRAALVTAEEESAKRTEEAIAAQQAEADYAPIVARRQASVHALNAQMHTLFGGTGERNAAREQVVARILGEIAYQQNRLAEAQAMVNAALAGDGGDYDAQVAALSAKLDAAESALDAVQSQLDALTAAREDAEQAEADARALVADYKAEIAEGEADVTASEQDKVEAERYDAETKAWLDEAIQGETLAIKWLTDAEHDLAHFGEGRGVQFGSFEYYHWRGARSGHQLYLPISFYAREYFGNREVDFGLSTGYVKSDTGFANGRVSGWTDTTLSTTIRNEKKVNSVRYGFTVSVPTGESRFAAQTLVPESLARFTDFGAGWQYTPGIEVVHRFTARDMLTGRLRYAFRRGYDYAREVPRAHVSPGDIFSQEIEYLHAGEKQAYMIQFYHNATTGVARDAIDAERGEITGKTYYRDGDDWELRFFYEQMVAPKDAVRCYTILAFTEEGTGAGSASVGRQYYGVGLRHHMTARADWSIMLHDSRVSSTYDPLRTSLYTGGGFRRRSLGAEIHWRPAEKQAFTFQLERYVRSDDSGSGYNGWGTMLWYQEIL